jgi:hypothetical protein
MLRGGAQARASRSWRSTPHRRGRVLRGARAVPDTCRPLGASFGPMGSAPCGSATGTSPPRAAPRSLGRASASRSRATSAASAPRQRRRASCTRSPCTGTVRGPSSPLPQKRRCLQLTIDPAPVPVHQHYAAVIAGCLERMAMLSRHRDERPWREHESIEARLLAQARAVVEARASGASTAGDRGAMGRASSTASTATSCTALLTARPDHGRDRVGCAHGDGPPPPAPRRR